MGYLLVRRRVHLRSLTRKCACEQQRFGRQDHALARKIVAEHVSRGEIDGDFGGCSLDVLI